MPYSNATLSAYGFVIPARMGQLSIPKDYPIEDESRYGPMTETQWQNEGTAKLAFSFS